MSLMKNQRISSLSTRYLGFYKNSVLVILVGFLLSFLYLAIQTFLSGKYYYSSLINTFYFGFLAFG